MIRKLSAFAPLMLLVACGGGGGEPAGNLSEGDGAAIGDARSYEGDNLTSIDAAANDASIQPLAPDTSIAPPPDNAAAAEPAE